MRTILCLIVLALSGCGTYAQSTFTRMYQSGTSHTFDLNELPSHNILTSMGTNHLLDPDGYITHSSNYFGGGTYSTQTLKAIGDTEFYFTTGTSAAVCTTGGTGGLVHPVLGKMDALGNVLSMRRYDLNAALCYNVPRDIEVTGDSGAITWGREYSFYAMRVNASLDHMWSKSVHRSGSFRFIKELPNGDLLAGINMDTAGVVVARMNADGEFIWAKSYIRPRGVVHDALIESDSSFVVIGFTDSMATTGVFGPPPPPTFQPKLFMMKLDGEGDVQWCRGWQSPTNLWYTPFTGTIERTLDSNYAVLANLGQEQNHNRFRPFLMKTDLNGDTIWTRSVGRGDFTYVTADLLPYSDGGFMISGIIYGDVPGIGTGLKYIYKADSLGHFPCWERVHPVQTSDLFPVDSSFTLAAVDVPTTVTPVFVTDTVYDPNIFTTYDGCTFTTGISLDMHHAPSKPRIRPNPNTGRFTLAFADPLIAESYYGVYDAMGKLLYQRQLPQGRTTEEVDLSRYGPGTYVIRCTYRDGVWVERVVVE